MEGARRVGDWLAAPLPRYGVRRRWEGVVVPVGNSAGAIEPIGGEGMGLAMASGEMGADFILKHEGWGFRANGLDELYGKYQKLWRLRSMTCRLAAVVVSRPWAAGMLLPLLNLAPVTQRVSLSLLGKGRAKAG